MPSFFVISYLKTEISETFKQPQDLIFGEYNMSKHCSFVNSLICLFVSMFFVRSLIHLLIDSYIHLFNHYWINKLVD